MDLAQDLLTEIRDELIKLRAAVGAAHLLNGSCGAIGPVKPEAWRALIELSWQPSEGAQLPPGDGNPTQS